MFKNMFEEDKEDKNWIDKWINPITDFFLMIMSIVLIGMLLVALYITLCLLIESYFGI